MIATAHSVHRGGYSVTVGASVPRTMSWWSGDVDRGHGIPSDVDRASQAKAIANLINDVTYVAMLPVNDEGAAR